MSMDIQIRACSAGDEETLALIGQATFLEAFAGVLNGQNILAHCANMHSVERYRNWLINCNYKLWLVEMSPGNAPVGYMVVSLAQSMSVSDSSPDFELKRIYIFSKFQGQGLGRKLVQKAISEARAHAAKRLLLGVYEHNTAAIGFYTRMGFYKVGTRKFNMGGLECDDDIMALTIPAAGSL